MVGVGKGAENNILIKDAESLELGHKVNAIVLDKTGTITEGRPVVTDIAWLTGESEKDHLAGILNALEAHSEHPLAEAVVNRLKAEATVAAELEDFESITGQGVKGSDRGGRYNAGKDRKSKRQNYS